MSVGKQRQGKAQASGQWITSERRLAIYLRDQMACLYCGRDLRDAAPSEITLDHLTPRSEGGTNVSENLVTACRACNSSRGAKPWREYATGGAIIRIERTILNLVTREHVAVARALIQGRTGDAQVEAAR